MNIRPSSEEETPQVTARHEMPEVWLEATPNDKIWMEKYGRLVAFRETRGHCNVSKRFEDDKELGSWVANQRLAYRAGTLRKDREKLLNKIEFSWASTKTTTSWMDRYNQLVALKEKNGHFKITADNLPLRNWLNTQRMFYRSGTLRQERKDLLDEIGMVWNVRNGRHSPVAPAPKFDLTALQNNEESWNRMFARLKEFYQQNGHTDVLANSDDLELLQWVSLQQNLHKLGRLDEKYEKVLCEIGFSWESQLQQDKNATKNDRQMPLTREDELWLSQFLLLCDFQQQHGHTNVPHTSETSALAQWWLVQQRLMKRGRLSDEKKQQLRRFLRAELAMTAASSSSKTSREPQVASVNNVPTTGPVGSHALVSEAHGVQFLNGGSQSRVKATAAEASSAAVASSDVDAPRIIQKFAIGTRIEKAFEVDGVLQVFGGNIFSFEQFEEDDGTHTWGYMIHYDDGDKEHMLEADVEKNLVVAKKLKRATKSHQNLKLSKRAKRTCPFSNDAHLAPSAETTIPFISNEATASPVQDTGTSNDKNSTETLRDSSKFRAETKKASGEDEAGRESRVRDAKLLRQPPNTASQEKVLASSKLMNKSENDSSSSEDEPLHLLVRKQARPGKRKANQDNQSGGADLEQVYLPDCPEVQTGATTINNQRAIQDEAVRKDYILRLPISQQINEGKESHGESVDKDHQLRMDVRHQYQSAANHASQKKAIQQELADKDQQLHMPVSEEYHCTAKKANKAKEIQHEIMYLVDDEEPTIADPPQTSIETVNHPPQKFPTGTTISRKFFDLSDN